MYHKLKRIKWQKIILSRYLYIILFSVCYAFRFKVIILNVCICIYRLDDKIQLRVDTFSLTPTHRFRINYIVL